MRNTASVQIDTSALRANLAVVKKLCPRSRVMAMVKANAYGHGLLRAAMALREADGLAVARLQEALLLRRHGITQRILLLSTLLDKDELALCSARNIDVTAHSTSSVSDIAEQSRYTPLRVWLELDSGMHRSGLSPHEFVMADRLLSGQPGVREMVHMTHFSDAEVSGSSLLERQMRCFHECRGILSKAAASLANSAALIDRPETHADWVRPGVMLYGVNPLGSSHPLRLRTVMRLCARIIAIRDIVEGESVGYNGTWTSERISRIGTVGIGYGDGYPRHARSGTPVWIGGRVVPLVGRVSMDSLTVDLTDCAKAYVGDEAVLWGPELPAARVAQHAATIPYELFTSLQRRVSISLL